MNDFADEDELVPKIHAAGRQMVLALNGGSRAIAELLQMPGGSRTLLEATVPYAEAALTAWLDSRPEQFCSARTARAMAVVGFGRARGYGAADATAAGIASSASLASDRPKLGGHRAHVALQTASRTACWSLELQKDARGRGEEENIVARMVLNAVADACNIAERLALPLFENEQVEFHQTVAPPQWQELFLGRAEVVSARGASTGPNADAQRVIFPGAFNPLHVGHRRMAEIAAEHFGRPVVWEISILNVDKPALDYLEIERRLAQFPPEQPVWLTRAATFDAKSRLFPGATFVVGVDTLQRIVDPRYYGGDRPAMLQAIQRLTARGCSFLVFGRALQSEFMHVGDIDLPAELRSVCREIPWEAFREDVSSTALRKDF